MDRLKLLFRARIGKVARSLAVFVWVICLVVTPGRFDRVQAQSTVTFQPTQVENNFPDGMHFKVLLTDPGVKIRSAVFLYDSLSVTYAGVNLQHTAQRETVAEGLQLQSDWPGGAFPPGAQVKFHWEVTFDDGQQAQSEPETYVFVDTSFTWDSIQKDKFTLSCHDREPQLCQDLADSASAYLDRFERLYDAKYPFRFQILVYNDVKEIQKWNSEFPDNGSGAAYPDEGVIVLNIPLQDNGITWVYADPLFSYQISHLLFLAAIIDTRIPVPDWLGTGTGLYDESYPRQDFVDTVMQAHAQNGLIPIAQLDASLQSEDADVVKLTWSESYSIVSFIMDVYGESGYRRLFKAYTDSLPGRDPYQIAFQFNQDELEARWQRWLSDPAGVKAEATQISLEGSPTPTETQSAAILSRTATPSESTPTPAPTQPVQATATPTPKTSAGSNTISVRQVVLYGLAIVAGLAFLIVLTIFLLVLFLTLRCRPR